MFPNGCFLNTLSSKIFSPVTRLNGPRWRGLRVGLLGGTFDPPHQGHVHISLSALQALNLHAVWWLVTPQNPLKARKPLSLERRMALCQELVTHPRVLVTDLEKDLGSTSTFETVHRLRPLYPGTDFVWITGMDNALTLHQWNDWQRLLTLIPMAHFTRMPAESLIKSCPLRLFGRQRHVIVDEGSRPPLTPGISYWLMSKKMINVSSSQIRAQNPAYELEKPYTA